LRTLRHIGQNADKLVPEATKLLGDSQWDVRLEAADALGNVGPKAKEAIPPLIKMLSDSDPIRLSAVRALVMIDPDADKDVKDITELLRNDRRVRMAATDVLGRIGLKGKLMALPHLKGLLPEKNPIIRKAAVEALGRIAPAVAERLASSIRQLIENRPEKEREREGESSARARREAAEDLGITVPPVKEVVLALTGLLADEDPGVRSSVPYPLATLALQVAEARKSLTDIMNDEKEDPKVRQSAREALKRIESP